MIYLLRISGTDQYKLGYTKKSDAEDRRRAAQTYHERPVEVYATWPGSLQDELACHKLLEPWRRAPDDPSTQQGGGQECYELRIDGFIRATLAWARSLEPYDNDPTLLKAQRAALRLESQAGREVWEGRYGLVEVARGALRGQTARYYEEDEATGLACIQLMDSAAEVSVPHDWLRMLSED